MVSNITIPLLLVQLSKYIYIDPENNNINFATINNDTAIGIVHLTKDHLLDAKRIQDLETENHMLSTELNMTEVLLHRAEENNQRLRHEQIRNRVKKALLRNVTSQYIITKKELDAKIARLAQVETTLNIYEKELGHLKQESELWRHKCEQYENKLFEVVEGELGKKAAKLKRNEKEAEGVNEICYGPGCKLEVEQRVCMEDQKWCCWLENATGSLLDNAVEIVAETNDEEKCKELALIEASKMNYVTIISELLDDSVNVQTSSSKSPLHWAAEKGHLEACKLLLNNYADINAHDPSDFNTTPVHIAAELGQISILDLFLQQEEVEINAKDADGWTPLHWAVTFNKTSAVVLLLNEGADVNTSDNDGESPLHHAALSGNIQIAKTLLAYNADVNATDNEGRTPLHFATLSNHFNASLNVTKSTENQHSASMKNSNTALGDNPCKILQRYSTSYVTKLSNITQSFNNSVSAQFLPSCLAKHDCKEITKILLYAHANPFAKDKKGLTPVDGAPEECRKILESWIDLHRQDL